MSHDPKRHSVRRIVLPSGRTIEVVRFQEPDGGEKGLHTCHACHSELMQPQTWGEAGGELTLRCPNCGWERKGLYSQEEIASLEERLDDGVAALVSDLQRLSNANMVDQVERFVSALHSDLILPEDF